MLRTSKLEKKQLANIQPGELFRYNFGNGTSLMLSLEPIQGGMLFGVISSPVFEHPMTSHTMQPDGICLSYGLGWVLEEIHGTETACGTREYYRETTLFIDEGLTFAFRAPERRYGFGPIYFDIEASKVTNISGDAAPVLSWRLWESSEHFDRGGAPLYQFSALAAS